MAGTRPAPLRFDADTVTSSTARTTANQARSPAKASGGNRIEVFRISSTNATVDDEVARWVARIDGIVSSGLLELRYQKLLPLGNGGAKPHYEILAGVSKTGDAQLLHELRGANTSQACVAGCQSLPDLYNEGCEPLTGWES